ncbi:serine hydrolase domain-containing protein [Rhabdothermincola salaria]|uniref:serine hydrolase domain-containing protein n=1 Tax=Rhabdothermincola salaria TaxID=2903142 RepID=UPI001E2FE814|nr:serine hydrolase domain-containing protein [Rhabdothermincola salaria]MCD9625350.1 beta-lactamase family protein [Rhabdothermincola salaria]
MLALLAAVVALLVLASACTTGRGDGEAEGAGGDGDREPELTTGPGPTYPTIPFADLDARLTRRVSTAELPGAALLVEQDGARLHTFATGSVDEDSPLPLGETGGWLTAAVLMSLVDDGLVGLDEPVANHLSSMAGDDLGRVTLRHLLSHTSGLPFGIDCADADGCDAGVARATLLGAPGDVFAVSPVGTHVAARLAEAVTGRTWATIAAERLLGPLAMNATSFPEPERTVPVDVPDPPTDGGDGEPDEPVLPPAPRSLLAVDGTTTAADLGRFLAMVLAKGQGPTERLLEAASVEEIERDQTSTLDTSREPWVAATGIPTHGLGVWRDRPRGDGTGLASVVSAPNQIGVYPLVDRPRNAWAVVAVLDDPLVPLEAVRDSAAVAQLVGVAIDTDGRAIREPGTPLGG